MDEWFNREVLRDNKGLQGATSFVERFDVALAGQTRRRVWWIVGLRIKYRVVKNGVQG